MTLFLEQYNLVKKHGRKIKLITSTQNPGLTCCAYLPCAVSHISL